jgi:hypothetical protein
MIDIKNSIVFTFGIVARCPPFFIKGDNPIFSCQAKSEEIVKSTTYRTPLILGIPPPSSSTRNFSRFFGK